MTERVRFDHRKVWHVVYPSHAEVDEPTVLCGVIAVRRPGRYLAIDEFTTDPQVATPVCKHCLAHRETP